MKNYTFIYTVISAGGEGGEYVIYFKWNSPH